ARSLQQRNTAEYHYFRKEHQGKALFVVTYGSFANRNQALAAISKLPEDIRQDNPWPRTLQSIQQELR
ncbi:MAG TPA: SPOR domain-containing protein, partial [Pseudomonadales bacterium]|nr:SPOR domain-containing protein [Pseudomonadales bacterium]